MRPPCSGSLRLRSPRRGGPALSPSRSSSSRPRTPAPARRRPGGQPGRPGRLGRAVRARRGARRVPVRRAGPGFDNRRLRPAPGVGRQRAPRLSCMTGPGGWTSTCPTDEIPEQRPRQLAARSPAGQVLRVPVRAETPGRCCPTSAPRNAGPANLDVLRARARPSPGSPTWASPTAPTWAPGTPQLFPHRVRALVPRRRAVDPDTTGACSPTPVQAEGLPRTAFGSFRRVVAARRFRACPLGQDAAGQPRGPDRSGQFPAAVAAARHRPGWRGGALLLNGGGRRTVQQVDLARPEGTRLVNAVQRRRPPCWSSWPNPAGWSGTRTGPTPTLVDANTAISLRGTGPGPGRWPAGQAAAVGRPNGRRRCSARVDRVGQPALRRTGRWRPAPPGVRDQGRRGGEPRPGGSGRPPRNPAHAVPAGAAGAGRRPCPPGVPARAGNGDGHTAYGEG